MNQRLLKAVAAMMVAALGIGWLGCAAAASQADLMRQHRGGTMRLVSHAAAGTIDPQINYTLQYFQVYQFVYDGLVAFQKAEGSGGFKLVPDLAQAIPKPRDGGKTYVFKLRQGIKFSNGQPLTVKDVVASLQRVFKISGPTAGTFYNGIVGAAACLKNPKSCTLEGGVVADAKAHTVTFHLTQADPEFFDKLAVPHASILPASTPAKDAGTDPIPGTGAYMIKSYNPNQRMVIVRNPYFKQWSAAAQPDGYPDRINYDFGLTDEAEVTAVANGQADWMFDPPPTDRLSQIGTKYAAQVHIHPLTAFYYLAMNTRLAPFNDVRVRRAVNYAVDRAALVNLFGGKALAKPVCTILPPGFPGHADDCIYTKNPGGQWQAPNMQKAKALIKQSGAAGQKVTIIVQDTSVERNIGGYMQSVLSDLGFKASVKAISPNIQFTYIQNTNNKVQISLSVWYQDYPAASNFLNILLSCGSFHPGSDSSINIAGFCNKKIDANMRAAMKTAVKNPKAANRQWAGIDHQIMQKAPLAPLFTPKHLDFTSKRVGHFVFSNQFYWVIPQSWVK